MLREVIAGVEAAQRRLTAEAKVAVAPELKSVSVPGVKFGIAFAEASGPCLVRSDGNDDGLRRQAENSILKIGAGHTFLILFTEAYPINLISNIRNVSEVAAIYCATSNAVQVIVAKVGGGCSVVGIADGLSPRAIESEDDKRDRSKLLRDLGYKRS